MEQMKELEILDQVNEKVLSKNTDIYQTVCDDYDKNSKQTKFFL